MGDPASAAPIAETISGRYRVERMLGQGGMGAVYGVVELRSQRRLALKRLSTHQNAAAVALFEREYHTLSGLRHPSIVEVYEYGTDARGPYYTMEWIEGPDLSHSAPMAWRDACRCLRDVASVLGLLHARHLLHRDPSPRNLLRTRGGRLKLIDFGALAPFGPSREVVGTAPFVAPEALQSLPLDQRADVFGLGALAYWLLTGAHAFPAHQLGDLPRLWKNRPRPASEMLGVLDSKLLPPIPPALDELISSMLRIAPDERLSSCSELIDRLNAIAGLEPDSEAMTVQGYLDSRAFVGRECERDSALALLAEARQGHVRTLVVEGDPGIGRSRFLKELSVLSSVAGALVVSARENPEQRPYGVAESILLDILRAAPNSTADALAEHARSLVNLSTEVRSKLSLATTTPSSLADVRAGVLGALREVVYAASREQVVVLIVDDVQTADEESLAMLTGLAQSHGAHKLMVVLGLRTDQLAGRAHLLSILSSKASRLRLEPLSRSELFELLRSVFGSARYLERLSNRLYEVCSGNPAHCLEVAQHLVHIGEANYREGVWILPSELPPEHLPKTRHEVHLTALARLSGEARELARHMSVSRAFLSLELCCALVARTPEQVVALLRELEQKAVLRAFPGGYLFQFAEVRAALYAELTPESRKQAHLRLATKIAAGTNMIDLERLFACLHFMRAGQLNRGYPLLREVFEQLEQIERGKLTSWATPLEDIYAVLREEGQDDYGLAGVLALLAMCGYTVSRRYALLYGEEAIAVHRRVLRLDLFDRWRRFLGAKLALAVAILCAGVALSFRRHRAPSLQQTVRNALTVAGSLAGSAAVCIDAEGVERCARAIEPFKALGTRHAAYATYEMIESLIPTLRDRPSEARRRAHAFLVKLERPIRELPPEVQVEYRAGALTSLGILTKWCDGGECLQYAARLDSLGPMHAMNADQLRAYYYANQGDLARARHYFERLEVHAVEMGTSWQVEARAPAPATMLALRIADVSMLKRAVQDLERLSPSIPSLTRHLLYARAMHLLLRRNYQGVIDLLESDGDEPVIGWLRSRGALAEAFNALGRHQQALAVCAVAVSRAEDEDFDFVAQNLNLQIQHALAHAGLGELQVAKQQLDRLLARHAAGKGRLTLGALHVARCRVAMLESNHAEAREQLAEAEACYRPTGATALVDQLAALRSELDRADNTGRASETGQEPFDDAGRLITRIQLLLREGAGKSRIERAAEGLSLAMELVNADDGFVLLAEHGGEPITKLGGEAPSAELLAWAEQVMRDAALDEQTQIEDSATETVDPTLKTAGLSHYRAAPLWAAHAGTERVVAALVLRFGKTSTNLPDARVMRAIARHLSERPDDA
jgi:serine/threonine protein kinase